MAWKRTPMEEQKMKFIEEVISDKTTFGDICNAYEISRKTGYKWLNRFLENGKDGLIELSRARHNQPNAVGKSVKDAILSIKQEFKYFGPRKVHKRLQTHFPHLILPSKTTVGNVLKFNNLTSNRMKRQRVPITAPLSHCNFNNDVWCFDFKGVF